VSSPVCSASSAVSPSEDWRQLALQRTLFRPPQQELGAISVITIASGAAAAAGAAATIPSASAAAAAVAPGFFQSCLAHPDADRATHLTKLGAMLLGSGSYSSAPGLAAMRECALAFLDGRDLRSELAELARLSACAREFHQDIGEESTAAASVALCCALHSLNLPTRVSLPRAVAASWPSVSCSSPALGPLSCGPHRHCAACATPLPVREADEVIVDLQLSDTQTSQSSHCTKSCPSRAHQTVRPFPGTLRCLSSTRALGNALASCNSFRFSSAPLLNTLAICS
jgi:hypothetical protein